jgi:DNA-binding NarL/FixJ family response regulator
MEQREDGEQARRSGWSLAKVRVILATNSPFVQGFFEDLAREPTAAIAVHVIAVDPSAVEHHVEYVVDAALVVVHSDPDLPAAQALCRTVGSRWPGLSMIALVSGVRAVTPWYVNAMLRGELSGLLDLETSPAELVSLLESVARGRVSVSLARDRAHAASIADALVGRKPSSGLEVLATLTDRERQVLDLLRAGASDKEIAMRLRMSPSTVGNHVRSIEIKLGARTRVELGVIAQRLEGDAP